MTQCVQQRFLCGQDAITGNCFEHRRAWVEDRIKLLAQHFSIDVCAYAIMHNHYHIVLKVNKTKASTLNNSDIIHHWTSIFKTSHPLIEKLKNGLACKAEKRTAKSIIALWRKRLSDISWFMRALNENIAKRANKESNNLGHFWASRFKSQALLDETAILSCMAYVDLNPIRAKIAKSIEQSDYTSIQQRVKQLKKAKQRTSKKIQSQPKWLAPLTSINCAIGVSFPLRDYLSLVDWTSRVVKLDKRGSITGTEPNLLERMNISHKQWLEFSLNFEKQTSAIARNSRH